MAEQLNPKVASIEEMARREAEARWRWNEAQRKMIDLANFRGTLDPEYQAAAKAAEVAHQAWLQARTDYQQADDYGTAMGPAAEKPRISPTAVAKINEERAKVTAQETAAKTAAEEMPLRYGTGPGYDYDYWNVPEWVRTTTSSRKPRLTKDDVETLFQTGTVNLNVETLSKLYPNEKWLTAYTEALAAGEQPPTMTQGEQLNPDYLRAQEIRYGNRQGTNLGALAYEQFQADMSQAYSSDPGSSANWRMREEYERQRAEQVNARGLTSILRNQASYDPATGRGFDTISVRQFFNLPFTLSDTQLRTLQVELFKAGYYQGAYDGWNPEQDLSAQIPLGDPYDPVFQRAMAQWLTDWEKDQDRSMRDILSQRQGSFSTLLLGAARKRAEAFGPIALTDPAYIRQRADQLGQAILGRKLTDADRARLVSMIHDMEYASGKSQRAAGAEKYVGVDPSARLAEQVRAEHPVEAQAHDVADAYGMLREMMAGPMNLSLAGNRAV